MAKNNYSYERRQRDLNKRKKQEEKREEKRLRKLEKKDLATTDEDSVTIDVEDEI